MSSLSSNSSDQSTGDTAPMEASRVVARIVTGLLFVMVPIMIGGICWRWATVHGPTTAIVVRGDASVEGAKIVVTGNGKKWTAEVRRENDWQVPILLDPGAYQITVRHHNRDIIYPPQPFLLDNLHGLSIDLPSMVWILSSPQLADAKIEIARLSTGPEAFTPIEVPVTSRDHYRTPRYLPAGTYQAIVHNRVTTRVEFTVERSGTAPLRVDLAKAVSEGNE